MAVFLFVWLSVLPMMLDDGMGGTHWYSTTSGYYIQAPNECYIGVTLALKLEHLDPALEYFLWTEQGNYTIHPGQEFLNIRVVRAEPIFELRLFLGERCLEALYWRSGS